MPQNKTPQFREISKIVTGIDVSPIKKMELLAREVAGSVSLAQGIPSFDTPVHIREAAIKAINDNLVDRYTPGYGIDPLREAICKKLAEDNQIEAAPEQVVVSHGALEGLMAVFLAILNPGDEVVVSSPNYSSHLNQITIAGGKAVCVPLDEEETWKFNPQTLEAAITNKTKALLLCNPSNPTGKVYSKEELESIVNIVKKHNLYIVTDEIYEYFTYDGTKHYSIGSFPQVADQTISVFGVSKSYAMTGWRIGYVVANKDLAYQIFKIHDSLVTCPTAVSQYAALAAITGPKDDVNRFKEAFNRRRDIVVSAFEQTDKAELTKPQGSYFALVKINPPIEDIEFAKEMLINGKVSAIPGSCFGKGGESHLRVSFGVEDERLKEGLKRMIDYLEKR